MIKISLALIMQYITTILHSSISVLEVNPLCSSLNITSSKSEKPTSSDDRHFSDFRQRRVPTKNRDGASVVFSCLKSKIHRHQKSQLLLGRSGVKALGLTQHRGVHRNFSRQSVVDHGDCSEVGSVCNRWLDHDGGWVWTA